MDKNFWKLI